MIPLLPAGDIFHSALRSKFSNSSSVTMSPPFAVCQSFFEEVSRKRMPSATFHAAPTGAPPYLCQPFVLCPSNNNCQPADFSWSDKTLFTALTEDSFLTVAESPVPSFFSEPAPLLQADSTINSTLTLRSFFMES